MTTDKAWRVRGFARFISTANGGEAHENLTRDYQAAVAAASENAAQYHQNAKATMTVTIEFVADKNRSDRVAVKIASKLKLPGPPPDAELVFVDEDGKPTLADPARDTMFAGVDLGRPNRPADPAEETN